MSGTVFPVQVQTAPGPGEYVRYAGIMTKMLPTRAELDPERTWDAFSIFPTLDAWRDEIEAVEGDLVKLEGFKGHLGDSAGTLLEALGFAWRVRGRAERVYAFAMLLASVDTHDQEARACAGRASSLYGRVGSEAAFIEPEILSLGQAKIAAFTAQESGLGLYAHLFDSIERQRAHTRSAEVEQLLGALEDPFRTASATHGTLTNAELKFEAAKDSHGSSFEVAHGSIGSLTTDPDRDLRQSAYQSYADAHLAFKNTMANALSAGVKQDVFQARARGYGSSLEAALEGSFIPTSVFHTLIETFKRFIPVWHRYWALRKNALGLADFAEFDIKAPLTNTVPHISYEHAVDLICDGMKPLGEEYGRIMRKGLLEDRWVDVYPNKGKRMGAFSTGAQGTHPFILMSYQDTLLSLSTLAHEIGHSMHSYHTWRTQPSVYADYGLFIAEVASNFNQALVRDHLLQTNPDKDFQISVLEEAMSNFHRYFFVMPTLARFELEIHTRVENGETLTADALTNLCADLFAEAYGPAVTVDRDQVGITWAEFSSHLYSNFYVHQYATGISGAHALARGVLAGKPDAATNYLKFLSAGSSLYPLDALKLAGVDLSSPEAVEETFKVLEGYVDRLEKLLG
jgi:oligoendopeptidase F